MTIRGRGKKDDAYLSRQSGACRRGSPRGEVRWPTRQKAEPSPMFPRMFCRDAGDQRGVGGGKRWQRSSTQMTATGSPAAVGRSCRRARLACWRTTLGVSWRGVFLCILVHAHTTRPRFRGPCRPGSPAVQPQPVFSFLPFSFLLLSFLLRGQEKRRGLGERAVSRGRRVFQWWVVA